MAAFDPATLERWRALAIVDRDGGTVGTISEFYLDRETGHPTWALVETGLFGTTQSFVPLVHATEISDGLQVPYEKRHIKDSPRVDLHDELTPEEEAALFAHYGVDYEPATDAEPGLRTWGRRRARSRRTTRTGRPTPTSPSQHPSSRSDTPDAVPPIRLPDRPGSKAKGARFRPTPPRHPPSRTNPPRPTRPRPAA